MHARGMGIIVPVGAVYLATTAGQHIFVSGKPLQEPIAWGGPIFMNTEEELEQAFREYREGTFIKS